MMLFIFALIVCSCSYFNFWLGFIIMTILGATSLPIQTIEQAITLKNFIDNGGNIKNTFSHFFLGNYYFGIPDLIFIALCSCFGARFNKGLFFKYFLIAILISFFINFLIRLYYYLKIFKGKN